MDVSIPTTFDAYPRHRSKVEAAARAGLENGDVVAMAVAGSFAEGIADELSDVDLRLYVSQGAIDRTVRGVPALARPAGR